MLNLDTEDWMEIFIGCAGGGDTILTLPVEHEAPDGSSQTLQLSITGAPVDHFPLSIARLPLLPSVKVQLCERRFCTTGLP